MDVEDRLPERADTPLADDPARPVGDREDEGEVLELPLMKLPDAVEPALAADRRRLVPAFSPIALFAPLLADLPVLRR